MKCTYETLRKVIHDIDLINIIILKFDGIPTYFHALIVSGRLAWYDDAQYFAKFILLEIEEDLIEKVLLWDH